MIGIPWGILLKIWIYFGQDGIISKSANCIKFGYHIFTNAEYVSDTCDKLLIIFHLLIQF